MSADTNTETTDTDEDSGGHCATPDSDGEVAEQIAIISFERKLETAHEIRDGIGDGYETVDIVEYHGDVFAEHWGEYDCFVGLMASGIAMRKTAPLLDDKWDDPAIVVIDEALTWAIPITGGHHGANQVANDLATLGAVPAMTTASEAAGKQGVESKAKALDTHVVNGDSTVATNLAVLNEELGPVARLDGPRAVLVGDDVTVLKRNADDGVVLGTGTVSGVRREQVLDAWERALADLDTSSPPAPARRVRRGSTRLHRRSAPVSCSSRRRRWNGSRARPPRGRRSSSAGRESPKRRPSPAAGGTNWLARKNGSTTR
jgi:cobalt-precorrin 5A hydrolase